MTDDELDDAIRTELPGWSRVKSAAKGNIAPAADAITKPLSALKKKYGKGDGDSDAGIEAAEPDVDTVVLQKNGKRATFDFDKKTKKPVTAQG